MAILTKNKVDVHVGNLVRDKEGYFLMLKELMHQGNIATLNLYTSDDIALKYMKQNKMEINRKCTNQKSYWKIVISLLVII